MYKYYDSLFPEILDSWMEIVANIQISKHGGLLTKTPIDDKFW